MANRGYDVAGQYGSANTGAGLGSLAGGVMKGVMPENWDPFGSNKKKNPGMSGGGVL